MKRRLLIIALSLNTLSAIALNDSIEKILSVGPEGRGNIKAAEAWKEITSKPSRKP